MHTIATMYTDTKHFIDELSWWEGFGLFTIILVQILIVASFAFPEYCKLDWITSAFTGC